MLHHINHMIHARPFGLLYPKAISVYARLAKQTIILACVNLAYTRCMRTLEPITPDHHVVLRNNDP